MTREWPQGSDLTERAGGGFRADLDVTTYVDRLGGGASAVLGGSGHPGAARERNQVVVDAQPYEYEHPMLFGREDMADTSTSTALTVTPAVIWDVNGYYRALGIPFPHRPVTRGTLARAHMAAGGLDDRWKTYCLNQLLDATVRPVYDRRPLGEPYLDDYWDEWFRKQARLELGRRIALGEVIAEDAEGPEAVTEVLQEWGLKTLGPDQVGSSGNAPTVAPQPQKTTSLIWSYYLWRCSFASVARRADRLDTWRTLLVAAFREAGIHDFRFRVGFLGKEPNPWMRVAWEGHQVFFLHKDQEPTTEYAAQAVHFAQKELGVTPTP